MSHIDVKYIRLISGNLRNFKQKKDNLFNFSCPICGDSKKDKTKARGFIFKYKSSFIFKCWNCGAIKSFGDFLKSINSFLYAEYSLETYKEKYSNVSHNIMRLKMNNFVFKHDKKILFENAEKIVFLPKNHNCIKYLKSRCISEKHFDRLLYTDNFKALIDEFDPKNDKKLYEEPRLIIPIFDRFNSLVAIAGRSLDESVSYKKRYITIRKTDYDADIVFGIELIDEQKPIFVVEGQIDSLFINNCIAMCHAELHFAERFFKKDNLILIPDNEPRAKIQVKKIEEFIENDFSVTLFPNTVQEKDINAMIISGMSQNNIIDIINKNTFRGIKAKLEFNKWKKC